jgi:hypothetical protein
MYVDKKIGIDNSKEKSNGKSGKKTKKVNKLSYSEYKEKIGEKDN